MNERIKELIEKATVRGQEYLPGNDGHPTPTFYFDKEKFAALIIEECCVIVNQEALLTDHVPAEMNAYAGKRLKNAYIKIEEHFGVEDAPVDDVTRILRTVRTRS